MQLWKHGSAYREWRGEGYTDISNASSASKRNGFETNTIALTLGARAQLYLK